MKVTIVSKAKSISRAARFPGAGLPTLILLAGLPLGTLQAQSTWNTTTGSWNTEANWDTLPVSGNTTQLIFTASGNTSYTTTNNIGTGTFTLNRLTVNNTGIGTITINGAGTANTLTFAGATPTLDITGTVLFNGLMAGSGTVIKTGTGTFIHDSNNAGFTGTLIVDQGAFINRATNNPTTNFNPVSIVVNNGGTYQFGENGTGDPNLPNSTYITVNTGGLVVWQEGENFGGYHLQGGTINLQAGATSAGNTAQNWSSGTLTGGAFTVSGAASINKTTTGTVQITGNASIASTGTLNILEGTIAMAGAANLGTVSVSLGDAAGTTSGTFDYQGGSATRGGGFAANAGGGSINVANATTTLTLTGTFSGAGNISKTGAGRLHVTGGLAMTGTLTAAAGTLQVDPGFALGSLAVAGGAVLSVNSGVGGVSFMAPTLNFLGGNGTLQFDLDTNAVTLVPLAIISSTDGLTFTGTPTLKLTNLQAFANGTYTLVDYDGAPITMGFNLALPGRTAGNLIYNTDNTSIDLSITGTDTLKWTGATSGNWDVGTAADVGGTKNWQLVTAGTSTNFIHTDSITFDDSATTHTVTLTTTVQPAFTTVNATANYTFNGSGKISGPTALNKAGTGTLVLETDNDYSGGTNITGGTVQVGNGGTTGSIIGTVTLNGGTLVFNRYDDVTYTGNIIIAGSAGLAQNGTGSLTITTPLAAGVNMLSLGGTGNLTVGATVSGGGIINKDGSGMLTLLANNNAFTGTLNVNAGTVLLNDLGAGGDLGATAIVVNSGGTFIFGPNGNADLPDATVVTINAGGLFRIEQGENFGGYMLNGGEFRYVSSGNTGVNSTGVASVAGGVVFDLRSGTITTDITAPGTGGSLNSTNGGILTKTTSGTVTVSGSVVFQSGLAMQLKEGTLAMNPNNVPASGLAMITLGDLETTGTLQINGTGSATTSRPFTLEVGGGTVNVVSAGTRLTINGSLTGTGGLTKAGDGALVLNASSDYFGGTTVVSGTLEVDNVFGSGTGSGPLIVNGTLAGNGGIDTTSSGNNVAINGVLSIGAAGAIEGADFNIATGVGGRTSFGASSIARLDLWSTSGTDQTVFLTAADLLLVSGDLQIDSGATLALGNPNGLSFQPGDVFRLFDWSFLGVRTGTWNIDASALNLGDLSLDTSELYTSGTVAITGVPEAGTGLLAMLGMGTFLLRRRRRSFIR